MGRCPWRWLIVLVLNLHLVLRGAGEGCRGVLGVTSNRRTGRGGCSAIVHTCPLPPSPSPPLPHPNSLTLSPCLHPLEQTLRSQFPAAAGLKYRNAETDSFRAMRVRDGRVPEPEGGWSDRVYVVVVAPPQEAAGGAKRSADEAGLNALPTAPSLLTGAPSQNRQLSEASHRLFIGNLPFTIRGEDHLKEFFPDATSISVPRHADTGKVKGFGYIVYPDVEQATAVLEKQNGLEIDGRQTYLDFAPYVAVFLCRSQSFGRRLATLRTVAISPFLSL